MRGRRNETVWLIAVVCAGAAAMAALAGTAIAGPVPKPPAQQQEAKTRAGHAAGHAKAGHHHTRPHTVVRCQNDDTDELDEFDSDSDEPRHIVTPTENASTGQCPESQGAIDIARILRGDDHAHPPAARPVR